MRLASPGLFPWFKNGVAVVTRSRVLASIAAQEFSRLQLRKGFSIWERPPIYTIDAWSTLVWQQARYSRANVGALLSPPQEHALWQKIAGNHAPDLFDVSAVARLASKAADIVAEYSIPFDHEAWYEQDDARQFLGWYEEFRAVCGQRGWMARRDVLLRAAEWGNVPHFLCSSDFVRSSKAAVRVPLRECETLAGELELAARWARARFEAAAEESIAVFVPELRSQRALVERTFQSVFYPGRAPRLDSRNADSVFHINSAQPLYEYPLIAGGLLLLELIRRRVAQADATAILRSPFLSGAAEERSKRAMADLQLRRSRELEVSLRDLEWASRECPRLTRIWSRIREVLRDLEFQAELSYWSKLFGDLLQAAGWPGDMELAPQEQELVEDWQDALTSLGALGLVAGNASFETALGHLKRLLGSPGPERGDWLSPVQILDAADAEGLEFDNAFLAGLGDENWPPPVRLSPLIPLKLQRAAGVPGADPAALRKTNLELTRGLLRAGVRVAGSYTGRLAPQVRTCGRPVKFDEDIWNGKLPLDSFAPAALEESIETSAPAVDLTQELRGGTSIIKQQSVCPFRAFAQIRLGARLPEDACFGFDARDRGGFLHKALELVWKRIGTQRELKRMDAGQVRELVHEAVTQAVANIGDSEFQAQASQVERERLELLILEWLETVEKARLRPFAVETVENELRFDLAGLPLTVRIDRVDRLENGGLVLIDYKSGANLTRNKLAGERPAEPQLLVYASAQKEPVEGVLFGQVRPRELRLIGFTREKLVKGLSITVKEGEWDEFLEQSRAEVERLASDFRRGAALVDPAKGACAYCDVNPLCRRREGAAMPEEAE